MKKTIPAFLILAGLTLAFPIRAEEAKTPAPAAASTPAAPSAASSGGAAMISANGFSCSTLEGKTQCQGAFKDVDKDLVIGARGTGDLMLRVKKRDKLYTYSSGSGCLCEEEEKEITCQNAQGKKQEFKGDKRQQESAAFCSLKK